MKRMYTAFLICFVGLTETAFAAGKDPFATATTKTNEITAGLAGGFAAAVAAMVLTIAGISLMFGKLSKEWFIKIAGGCVIIICAGGIASMFLG